LSIPYVEGLRPAASAEIARFEVFTDRQGRNFIIGNPDEGNGIMLQYVPRKDEAERLVAYINRLLDRD
jgi:hypothetical protein